jgi:RNA polymerase sigma factor (sigma-70 family)
MPALHAEPDDAKHPSRFHALYRGEFAFVWSAAQHLGVPSGAVDDVVQDVFLTAYRRLDQLHFEVSPRAWLFGVTRRVAFRYRRGAARQARRHAAFAEVAPTAATPQQRHDDAQLLNRVLGELSDGTRVVWEMTELLGMSAPEIASELGLPLNTVYSRLRLARRQLQALVADEQLDRMRDAARERQAPPPEAESRTWGLILPALGKSGAAAGLTAWASTKAAAATTMIVAGAAAVGLVVAREPARASEPPPPPAAPTQVERASAPGPSAETKVEEEVAAAPSEEAPPPVSQDMRKRTSAPEAPDAGARLAEEVAAIDRARARLGAGDPAGALAAIEEHARRFPQGTLADVREAARVEALCGLGDEARASAAARLLVREFPASAVAQRFAEFSRCPR